MRVRHIILLFAASLVGAIFVSPANAASRNYTAHLSADQEVADPAVVSDGTGQAIFRVSKDGDSVEYRLNVANIENVTQAHIHMAPAGINGQVVAFLYPSEPPAQLIPGRSDGVLATGTITDADLRGPLTGATIEDLVAAFDAGNAYVNVHTEQHPAGEIRGQI